MMVDSCSVTTVMDEIKVTEKLLLALLEGIFIVRSDFLIAFEEMDLAQIPEEKDYIPVSDFPMNKFLPNLKRKNIFKDMKFKTKDTKQLQRLENIINAAGGRISFESNDIPEGLLLNSVGVDGQVDENEIGKSIINGYLTFEYHKADDLKSKECSVSQVDSNPRIQVNCDIPNFKRFKKGNIPKNREYVRTSLKKSQAGAHDEEWLTENTNTFQTEPQPRNTEFESEHETAVTQQIPHKTKPVFKSKFLQNRFVQK